MPLYKYSREDIIRQPELDEIIQKASETHAYGLPGSAWSCLIGILWLFGKRISEVVPLKVDAVNVYEKHNPNPYSRETMEVLSIRFNVLKKRRQSEPSVIRTFTKRVTLENPYTKLITYWVSIIGEKSIYLFPRPQTRTGHIYREYAYNVLKSISPNISSHLFRHSLASQMAEEGATAYELINWFDWDRTDTALEYIRRSGAMTERLSKRKW
jgi:integrase